MNIRGARAYLARIATSSRVMNWPNLVSFVLSLLLCAKLVVIARAGFYLDPRELQTVASSANESTQPRQERPDINAITSAFLFGRAQESSNQETQPSQAPLLLRGVIAVRDPTLGYAIIGGDGETGALRSVGEVVDGEALLKEIYADHVVLDRGGVLETLAFPVRDPASLLVVQAETTPDPIDEQAPAEEQAPTEMTAENPPEPEPAPPENQGSS